MIIEVIANFLTLYNLLLSNARVPFLKLLVLQGVFPRELLVLLLNDLGFGTAVLIL